MGLEPTTFRLKAGSSTNWATRSFYLLLATTRKLVDRCLSFIFQLCFHFLFNFCTRCRNWTHPPRFWRPDRHLVCIVCIFWVNDGLRSRYLWLHKPALYRLSYIHHITPLHQINGLAAIWEWGSPVISGLRGEDGLRSRSSGFSDQRNDHICHFSI